MQNMNAREEGKIQTRAEVIFAWINSPSTVKSNQVIPLRCLSVLSERAPEVAFDPISLPKPRPSTRARQPLKVLTVSARSSTNH